MVVGVDELFAADGQPADPEPVVLLVPGEHNKAPPQPDEPAGEPHSMSPRISRLHSDMAVDDEVHDSRRRPLLVLGLIAAALLLAAGAVYWAVVKPGNATTMPVIRQERPDSKGAAPDRGLQPSHSSTTPVDRGPPAPDTTRRFKLCPRCGFANPPEARFCLMGGKGHPRLDRVKVETAVFCPNPGCEPKVKNKWPHVAYPAGSPRCIFCGQANKNQIRGAGTR